MYQKDYGNGMTTSNGDKVKIKKGSPDANTNHSSDMYDMMPPMPSASAPADTHTGGMGKVTADATPDPDLGSKAYGKGNPYKKKAKASFKSFQDLRDYSEKMGY